MFNNISEKIQIPASLLISSLNELPVDIKEAIHAAAIEKYNAARLNRAVDESIIQTAISVLPEDVRKELDTIGAVLPSDMIELKLSVGEVLYAIYESHTIKPNAPLAAKRYDKELLDLATLLDTESYPSLPQPLVEIACKVMSDDKLWEDTKFAAVVTSAKDKRFVTLTAKGVTLFRKVLYAASDMIDQSCAELNSESGCK